MYTIISKVLDRAENIKTYQNAKDTYYTAQASQTEYIKPSTVVQSSEPSLKPLLQNPTKALPPIQIKPQIQEKFKALIAKNEDVIGWLKLDNTVIDYPVTQSNDNEFYLEHDVNKQKNQAGSIFMDYRNNLELSNRNLILYGHDMLDKSMFAAILSYESKYYWDAHPIIHFDTKFNNQDWEVFSAYTTDVDFDYIQTDFKSNKEYNQFLQLIQQKSVHPSTLKLAEDDTILTLSTCSYAFNNARFVVHARLRKSL
jgi:sortase B